jgi:hypothetical protein
MRLALPALLAAILLAGPGAAAEDAAPDVAAARAHFRRAADLYAKGSYRDAIAEFEAAYRARPHGAIHFNVAQCREKLGELPQALRSYHDYLREVPQAEDRAAVVAAMRRIDDRLAASGVQALLVSSEPPGAEVRVDGRPRGKTPFVIALPPGGYGLALERPGFAPAVRQVSVTLDGHAVVEVQLEPASPAVAAAAPAPGPSPGPTGADATAGGGAGAPRPPADLSAPAPSPIAAPSPPPAVREHRRVWTWVAAGAAIVAAGAGAYFGNVARQKSDDLTGSVHDSATATALAQDARSASRTANVLYGVAAGAAAAGATLFVVEGRF